MSNSQRSKTGIEKRYDLYQQLAEIYYILYSNYEEDHTFYIEKLGHSLVMIEASIKNLLNTSSSISDHDRTILITILKALEDLHGTVS